MAGWSVVVSLQERVHVMTFMRITAGINNTQLAGRKDVQIGFADALQRVFPTTVAS